MKVSVVIPHWKYEGYLSCLEALKKQTYPDFEIIVVDNGSTDGSADYIEKHFPEVQLVRHDKNRGFAGGVNGGIKVAQGEYVALLNDDAEPEPSWLAELVKVMETEPKVGFVTSKILNIREQDGERQIDSTGDYQSIWGLPFPRGRGEIDHGQYDDKTVIFAASGGATLYRMSMLKQIGLFDERYFAYYEDVDLSFRGQLAGWQARFAPKAVVLHHIGATSGGVRTAFTRYHAAKNLHYLYLKNMPGWLFWKYLPRFKLSLLLSFISSVKHGFLLTHLKAWATVIWHLPGILLDRWRIQSRRRVSTEYIDGLLLHSMPPVQKTMLKRYLPFVR